MAIRRVTVEQPNQSGGKVMMLHVTRNDLLRIGSRWYHLSEAEWLHGYVVDAVKKQVPIADNTFAAGDTLRVRTLSDDPNYAFDIARIEMCTLAEFDFSQMGCANQEEFVREYPLYDVRRVWLLVGQRRMLEEG